MKNNIVYLTKNKKGFEVIENPKIPKEVKNLLRKKDINWVEIGTCADLSTIRGYFCDDNLKLHQKTGSNWQFFLIGIFTEKEIANKVLKEIKEGV